MAEEGDWRKRGAVAMHSYGNRGRKDEAAAVGGKVEVGHWSNNSWRAVERGNLEAPRVVTAKAEAPPPERKS